MAEISALGRVFDAYQNLSQIARCIEISNSMRGLNRPTRVLELSRRATGLENFVKCDELVRYATHVDGALVLELPLRLPFDDNVFDACIVTEAYEHMPATYRQDLLSEMMRVTQGIVLLGCPNDDELVNRFDRIAFDFIWGKYARQFEPLAQHLEHGLESLANIKARLELLGATALIELPVNFVYRWIHQLLVYFDLQHANPHANIYENVNRTYNELLSPYDYREPCYRYLIVVAMDPQVKVQAFADRMIAPIETPQIVAEAEGAMIDAFRASDSRAADLLRSYTSEMDVAQAELARLRSENTGLETMVAALQADNQWAIGEIDQLRVKGRQVAAPTIEPPPNLDPPAHPDALSSADVRSILATQRWTAHNMRVTPDVLTIPGAPDFLTTDLRLAAIRRTLASQFGSDLTGVRIADLGCLEGGFAVALALEGASVVGVEARRTNLEKADLLRRQYGLTQLTFALADVKDFTVEKYGEFDAVLALGIAYHLDRPAAWLDQIARAARELLIVDSHVAPARDDELQLMRADLRGLSPVEVEFVHGRAYHGRWFTEFDESISTASREEQLWASWSNHRSFWLTEESLVLALRDAGFDIVSQQHDVAIGQHEYQRTEFSRGMYNALRSSPRLAREVSA